MNTKVSPWIHSRVFDLTFIFGGALMVLALPLIGSLAPAIVLFLFWSWVIFFEGPHFAATYSRTYWDDQYRASNSSLLFWSMIFFVLPALAVVLNLEGIYGFFIFTWSLYHNTRQHYGFTSMYSKKTDLSNEEKMLIKWGIYLACYIPMLEFFVNSKLRGNYPFIYNSLPLGHSVYMLQMPLAFYLIFLISKLYKKALLPLCYIVTSWFFYSFLFYFVLRNEPYFFSPSYAGDTMLLVVVLNSIFHNIQYLAICWLYGKRNELKRFDLKFWLGAWVFGILIFFPVFFLRGEFSFWIPNINAPFLKDIAYVLYFGIVGHHFYLDQKVWRLGKQASVQKILIQKD